MQPHALYGRMVVQLDIALLIYFIILFSGSCYCDVIFPQSTILGSSIRYLGKVGRFELKGRYKVALDSESPN